MSHNSFSKRKGLLAPLKIGVLPARLPRQQTCVHGACLACVSALRSRGWDGSAFLGLGQPGPGLGVLQAMGLLLEPFLMLVQWLSLAAWGLSGGACTGALPAGGGREGPWLPEREAWVRGSPLGRGRGPQGSL